MGVGMLNKHGFYFVGQWQKVINSTEKSVAAAGRHEFLVTAS